MKQFTKSQILKVLKDDLHHKLTTGKGSNDSKHIKQFDYVIDKVQKYFKDGETYELIVRDNHINFGVLIEIAYKAARNKKAKFSPKGEKDLKGNKHYSEIKTLISSSNYPQVSIEQMNQNKGIIVLTLQGVYHLESQEVLNHWDEIDHRGNKHHLKIDFVRKYGKLTSEEF